MFVYITNDTNFVSKVSNDNTFFGCLGAFKSQCQYKDHLIQFHNRISLSCAHCHYKTDYKSQIIRHLKTHWNERPFVCNIDDCGKTYKYDTTLKRHQSIHNKMLSCSHEKSGADFLKIT